MNILRGTLRIALFFTPDHQIFIQEKAIQLVS
jgi:hypothetical protein